ncbi:hypothetical protein FVE85_8488 [Porphyridium purpureum]|uniref:PNPLA domain-containing protein n=1 Tax=Porphyridium purpureum TaxID=35688 RepID=A0A5J4YKR5_PORPP|nr:hypothetical protein FVE85_8488 [Porphyridium purpureum]|eukprot:POR1330..scf244_11
MSDCGVEPVAYKHLAHDLGCHARMAWVSQTVVNVGSRLKRVIHRGRVCRQRSHTTCAHGALERRTVRAISFPGGGILFWWQLGVVQSLRSEYERSGAQIPLVGASCGAFSALMLACGVDAFDAYDSVCDLVKRHNVLERGPLGLYGIWSRLIEEWLDELLASRNDVEARLASANMEIRVLHLLDLSRARGSSAQYHVLRRVAGGMFTERAVSHFVDRHDAIQACLASAHIPFFIDGQPLKRFRSDLWTIDAYAFQHPFAVTWSGTTHSHVGETAQVLAIPRRDTLFIHHELDGALAHEIKKQNRYGASVLMSDDQLQFVHLLIASGMEYGTRLKQTISFEIDEAYCS